MKNPLRSKTISVTTPNDVLVLITLVRPKGVSDADFHRLTRKVDHFSRELGQAEEAAPADEASPAPDAVTPAAVEAPSPEPIPASGRKLFVGNLPFDWTEEALQTLFAGCGAVTRVEIARFRRGGRSRGFGFVEMETEDDAQNAIQKLHEQMAGTRKMTVRIARSQEQRAVEPVVPTEETTSATPAPETESAAPATAPRAAKAPARSAKRRRSRGRRRSPAAPAPTPALSRQDRAAQAEQREKEMGIVNNSSGYEYFPRRRT